MTKPLVGRGASYLNWRRRRYVKTTSLESLPTPAAEKVYIFPSFSLNWSMAWTRIKNGELVVTETISSADQKPNDFDLPVFQSQDPIEMVAGLIPPGSPDNFNLTDIRLRDHKVLL
ncbi:MAG: hypothetical protein HY403_10660 [Elusimicrobia bacterium]|nr:hypothetical protein [Elusimicrobiota bacterium]